MSGLYDNVQSVIRTVDLRQVARKYLGEPEHEGRGSKPDKYRCPNPSHSDSNASFAVYADHYFCYGCSITGRAPDLLHILGVINLNGNWFNDFLVAIDRPAIETEQFSSATTEVKAPRINQRLAHTYMNNLRLAKSYLRQRWLWPPPRHLKLGAMFKPYPLNGEWFQVQYISIPHLWHDRVWGIKLRRNDLWLLERKPELDAETYAKLVDKLDFEPRSDQDWLRFYDELFPRYTAVTDSDFGIYNADILDIPQRYVFTTEGEFDAIMLIKMGYPAVQLKPRGNGFNGRLDHLFRRVEHVVTVADRDEAGETYAEALRSALGAKCTVIQPPVGKDVCEAVADYKEALWLNVAIANLEEDQHESETVSTN